MSFFSFSRQPNPKPRHCLVLAVIISFLTNKLDVSIIHVVARILRTINIRLFRRSNAFKGDDSLAATIT